MTSMLFIAKKTLSHLLLPLPIAAVLLVSGLMLLASTRKKNVGRAFIVLGTLLLLAASCGFVADRFAATLENHFPPLLDVKALKNHNEIKWVVVLGAGTISDPRLPRSNRLTDASLVRLLEGVRLHRDLPSSKLLFSGGSAFQMEAEGEMLAMTALWMGVSEKEIVRETGANDTDDQARLIAGIVGRDPFILVTSAIHMPRAMYLFRKSGLNPVAAPTGYLVFQWLRIHPRAFFPGSEPLRKTEAAIHEYIGLVWAHIR